MTERPFISPQCKIPAGRYALFYKPTGKVRFFTLRFGVGKWNGFPFLDEHAGPNRIPVKNRALKDQIINAIARDLVGSMQLFAKETNRCGKCFTELTDPKSRAKGIGPDCEKKYKELGYKF